MLEVHDIQKKFVLGEATVHALRGVSLSVASGEFVAVMGASGSGKSTLMNILGCLDKPTSGAYAIDGVATQSMSKNEFARLRNQKIGFVFQGFNLLSRTSALENVELPLLYNRNAEGIDIHKHATRMLEMVGLVQWLDHEPTQLSGGQQQRIAIARALVNNPRLILADEPTGNLDSTTSVEIMRIFQELHGKGITIMMVTHELDIAQYAERVIEMKDGRIVRDRTMTGMKNYEP